MQLYFIRHGQSKNNALWGESRDVKSFLVDPDLTPIGRRQVELLAEYLAKKPGDDGEIAWDPQNSAGYRISHIYTSLMLRAATTGTIIATRLGLPLIGWIDLHERGGLVLDELPHDDPVGYPGPNRSFFEVNYPDLILPDEIGEQGWWSRPWEDQVQRRERARRVAKELLDRHGNTEDRVALVSHGGFYVHLMAALFEFPDEGHWWFLMNNSAVTRVDFLPQEIQLVYHNRVAHLPGSLIT